MAILEKTCLLSECNNIFTSKKSLYCCKECRKKNSLIRRKDTNFKKFGVENPFQSPIIKDQIKNTLMEKYGVDNPMRSATLNNKAHNTMYERHGHRHALQSDIIKSRMQETMIDRHGASSSLTSDTIKSQIFDTNAKRYGNSIFSISHISIEKYQLLNNKDWLIEQNKTKSVDEIRTELGVGQTVVNQRFREFGIIPTKFNSSSLEKSVISFLKDNNIDFICHNRDILGGKELDIFIPEIKLAIECNGTYWHSDLNGKDRNYHLEKTLKSKKSGVDLFHLWEHEWTHKSDIIKSMMLSRLNKLNKIHARKCDLRYVSSKDSKIFLNDNHLQGYCASETCVGLYNNNILVSLMSFRDNRFTSGKELLRFCNVKGTHVVGAASKLFSYFIKKYDVTSIISYSHKDKFTGDMYKRLGFKLKHISPPAYYYTKDYENVENRMKYQKHKLQKLLPIFESSNTEWENMQNNGYDRIWDCGNDVWEFKKEDIQC